MNMFASSFGSRLMHPAAFPKLTIACVAVAATIDARAVAQAFEGTVSVRTAAGLAVTPAEPGELLELRISLDAPSTTTFNAFLGRLVFTSPGIVVHSYEWSSPFETGGITDFSLVGLELPVEVVPSTLSGAGYPSETSDVEFGNFLLSGAALPGTVLAVEIEIPASAKIGSDFLAVLVPDLVTDGFMTRAVGIGIPLAIEVQERPISDLNLDWRVDAQDLAMVIAAWGPCPPGSSCPADLDGNGSVGPLDLGRVLSDWR